MQRALLVPPSVRQHRGKTLRPAHWSASARSLSGFTGFSPQVTGRLDAAAAVGRWAPRRAVSAYHGRHLLLACVLDLGLIVCERRS
jgi:hypothetical protein